MTRQNIFSNLAPNEVKVIVHVIDENDNAPRFKTNGRPMVAAIPNTAPYGHVVTKIEVGPAIFLHSYFSPNSITY